MSADYEFADPGGPRREVGRQAYEWGLSALFIGSVLTILFPVSLLVLGLGAALAQNWRYWDPDNLKTADTVARVVGYCGVGAGGLGLLFALFGLLRGLIGRQPLGTCIGGLVLSGVGLTLMVMLMIVINVASREFYKELQHRRPDGGGQIGAPGGNFQH
jgi:hypothetical protein